MGAACTVPAVIASLTACAAGPCLTCEVWELFMSLPLSRPRATRSRPCTPPPPFSVDRLEERHGACITWVHACVPLSCVHPTPLSPPTAHYTTHYTAHAHHAHRARTTRPPHAHHTRNTLAPHTIVLLLLQVMTHPGRTVAPSDLTAGCGTGPDFFACSSDREVEMATLTGTLRRGLCRWGCCQELLLPHRKWGTRDALPPLCNFFGFFSKDYS
jgi:hypothetical protein